MMHRIGIKDLEYPRKKLIEILKKNREAHKAEFKKAMEEYKIAIVKAAEELLENIKNGDDSTKRLDVVKPVDHSNHYDRAIAMFELATADNIELKQEVFEQLVLDQWDWKDQLAQASMSNSKYLG